MTAEGYYLQEMQRALNVVEAAAWHVTVDRSNILNLVHHLTAHINEGDTLEPVPALASS